jgi:lipoprotein-releasing system permease protein
MNRRLNIRIALSLLMARWRQTLVAAIGVTFSISMFIALLGFMIGLNKMLDDLFLNRTPHIRLYNDIQRNPDQPIIRSKGNKDVYHFISSIKTANSRKEIYNSAGILKALQNDKRVSGISPKVSSPAFFNNGSARLNGVINGVDVVQENKVLHFYDYIVEGSGADLAIVPNSVVLGGALADLLSAEIGDMVYLTTSTGEIFPLKLVGLYQSGISDLDKVTAYTSLTTAQKLLSKPANYLTDIQVKIHNMNDAPALAKEYQQLFETKAEDIQSANAELETGTNIRTLIAYAVGITLLIVAGFGIYNILNMMIYEKMDSIAILKATGFSGTDVKRIFLFIALSIGIAGGLVGLLLGFGLASLIDIIPFEVQSLPTITTYPVSYDPVFYFTGILFSIVTTYLAGSFPAAKAGKVDPVVIIRGK